MIGKTSSFHLLRCVLAVLLSALWTTTGSTAALAERSDLGPSVLAANSAPRAFWMGKDGLQAAQAAGYQTMQASQKALAAARAGDLSLLRAESAAWAKGASGEMPVFVGKAAQACKRGDNFREAELPTLLDKVNQGAGTIKYNFLK